MAVLGSFPSSFRDVYEEGSVEASGPGLKWWLLPVVEPILRCSAWLWCVAFRGVGLLLDPRVSLPPHHPSPPQCFECLPRPWFFAGSFGVLEPILHLLSWTLSPRVPSRMALADPPSLLSCTHTSSIHTSRDPSWTTPGVPEPLQGPNSSDNPETLFHIDLASELDSLRIDGIDALTALDSIDTPGPNPEKILDSEDSVIPFPQISIDCFDQHRQTALHVPGLEHKGPFHKWMRSLHRRATHRPAAWDPNGNSPLWQHLGPKDANRSGFHRRRGHRKSSSGSSFGFVSAVQSASVSLASVSAVTRSRRNTTRSHCPSRTDRSSRASLSGPRLSEDSMTRERPVTVDTAATQRSLQRRQILEELINTEENYIGDVRFLMNVS